MEIKTWVQPNGELPKYYHTRYNCIVNLEGRTYRGERAPAGVEFCLECERDAREAENA